MSEEKQSNAAVVVPTAGIETGLAVARVVLKPKKIMPFLGRHPWVFESAIQLVDGEFSDGDVVDLCGAQGKFIARGIINSQSKLQVRLYTWNADEPLDDEFWRRRLERAIQLRREFGGEGSARARRLVFSEADGLSGLIVDQYADFVVAQVNALAMARRWERILPGLVELTQPRGIIVRADKSAIKEEGLQLETHVAWGSGPEGPIFVEENGIRFGVDVLGGQKTGFYLDQAENRGAAAKYLKGRRVLDVFCYTGGFSLAASRLGQAAEVIGVDGSDRAITLARANAELNGITNARFEQRDGFEAVDEFRSRGEKFGGVILDPPKFARGRRQVDEALRAYHRINRVAVDLLVPGGILVTCSCSGGVSREDFMSMLSGVAQRTGRDIQVLEQRGAAADHPTSVTCLETDYLKCFICQVG
jgi:23S rRNA (cytosine1962-C5)-methyltransferase